VGEEIPELVLVNSHDGTSGYQLMAGIFRLVCSNGLVVQSADFGSIRVHHSGGKDFQQRVIEATYQIVEEAPRTMAAIEAWKQIELTRPQQVALAEAAMEIKPMVAIPARPPPHGPQGGRLHRRGGPPGFVVDGECSAGESSARRCPGAERNRPPRPSRPIKSVSEDIRVNRALWTLTAKWPS
jgi:hypothetical protein